MPVNKRFFDSLMTEKRLSLRGLAGKMGISHSQLSLTFSGSRRMQLDEAVKLSTILGVPLHTVALNAGVSSATPNGKRVAVVGSMNGTGEVEVYDSSVLERTVSPEGLPEGAVAIQARTGDSALAWMDGWVFFFVRSDAVDPGALGRFCFVEIKDGPAVLAQVRRGYREGTYNLSGPISRESQQLKSANPILLTRN